MFERVLARLEDLETAGDRALVAAAPRALRTFHEGTRTRRGNVPAWGRAGDPPTITPGSDGLTVRAPEWVMRSARARGVLQAVAADLADEVHRAAAEGP